MVARDVYDLSAGPDLFKNIAHDMVVDMRPAAPGFQLPEVNDIANKIEIFRLGLVQKVEQEFAVGVLGAEVNVREPD